MLWLCDRPEQAGAVAPPGSPAPERCTAGVLDAPTAALWRTLGDPGLPWSLAVPRNTPASAFWSRVIVTSHAPSSRFDLLRGPLVAQVRALGPVACVALDGDGFHGHHGRSWNAAAGNLQLTVALPARLPAAALGAALSMLPAVAVCDAVASVTSGAVQPSIKWVNDIVVAGGKLAGVLTTTRLLGAEIDHVVFGIGVNVAVAPAVEPTPFVPSIACLNRCPGGERISLGALLRAVLDALQARLTRLGSGGATEVHQEYVRRSLVLGRHVRVWDDRATDGVATADWPPPIASGLVGDIGADLALALEGRREPVERGRLALEEDVRVWLPPRAR